MNNTFQWTDELVNLFVKSYFSGWQISSHINECMDKFKASKAEPQYPRTLEEFLKDQSFVHKTGDRTWLFFHKGAYCAGKLLDHAESDIFEVYPCCGTDDIGHGPGGRSTFRFKKAEPKKEWEILSSRVSESSSDEQKIMTVRRLSDGEVFSVGDMVCNSAGPYRIGRFEESCPGHLMIIVDTGGSIDLKDARHSKNCPLPTQDPKKEDQPETFGIRLTLGDFMKLRRLLDSFEKV